MSSGNSGMTRSTSVIRFSTPSVAPPTYAAVTPMIAAIAVAASPAPNEMIRTCRVPHTTCANMSWP